MVTISVHDMVGSYCADSETGAKLNLRIREVLDAGESVCLDFRGVETLATRFLNNAVGSLYGVYASSIVDSQLTVTGLDKTDENLLECVKRNAVRFYGVKPDVQASISKTRSRVFEQ